MSKGPLVSILIRASLVTTALGAATGAPAEAAPPSKRALVIGIDQYVVPGAPVVGTRIFSDLAGAANDADDFRQLLLDRYGFSPSEIKLLRNRDATRAAILQGVDDWLFKDARAGDTRVFFYAGHGSQVANSKSAEADKLDETLVPADAGSGAPDIRDKELRQRFASALARKVAVTAVLDSCHSGSGARGLTRGKARLLPGRPDDVADPATPPDPIALGALVLSAAQDTQYAYEAIDEQGRSHGAFTLALIRALRSGPAAEPVDRVYLRARALMNADGTQDPVLGAEQARKQRTLLGGPAITTTSKPRYAIERAAGADDITLQAGSAEGLAPGCGLVKRSAAGAVTARLEITAVTGLARSRAKLKEGAMAKLRAGDLVELERWVLPDAASLILHVPPAWPAGEAVALDAALMGLPARFARSRDFTSEPPTHVLRWDGSAWQLDGPPGLHTLGAHLDTNALAAALGRPRPGQPAQVILGVVRPAPAGFAERLLVGRGSPNPALELGQRGRAQYHLVGRPANGRLELAWVLAGAGSNQAAELPLRTDWIDAGAHDAALRLTDLALRLARLRGWLTLRPPPGEPFPFQLALVRVDDKQPNRALAAGEPVRDGDRVQPVLRPLGAPATSAKPRHVYVFTVDSRGRGQLIFPRGGGVENRLPASPAQGRSDTALGAPFTVAAPFGTDHFYLLAADDKIPDPYVLQWDGVARAGGVPAGETSPLARLLSGVGVGRGVKPDDAVPATWSLERRSLTSQARPASASGLTPAKAVVP